MIFSKRKNTCNKKNNAYFIICNLLLKEIIIHNLNFNLDNHD